MSRIIIAGEISSWGYSARWLRGELNGKSGDIEVEISSYGGDVFEGVDMYNELKKYSKEKGKVTTIITSKAMSIASLIFLAGDIKKAYSNSTIMIHKAWTWMAGNADELLKEAKVLDSIDNVLVNTYSKFMKEDKDKIKSIMKEEGWYIGKEQIQPTGFVNEFLDSDDSIEDIAFAKKSFENSINDFKAKAKAENAKPNLEIAAKAVETLATMPSDSEKIVNKQEGVNMEFNEENFKILAANKKTLDSRLASVQMQLETATAALDSQKEELNALKAESESKLSEAKGELENYKSVVATRLKEASASNVDASVALAMVDAPSEEEASRLALAAKSNTEALKQGNGEQSEDKKSDILAFCEKNKGSIR